MNVHHFGNFILNLNLEGKTVAVSEKFNAQITKPHLFRQYAIMNSQMQHNTSNSYKM